MKIQNIAFDEIKYESCKYSENLKKSIKRIALSFPIKVQIIDQQYVCIDGHKRMSAIHDLHLQGYQKLHMIPVIVMNNARTANGWSIMNHH